MGGCCYCCGGGVGFHDCLFLSHATPNPKLKAMEYNKRAKSVQRKNKNTDYDDNDSDNSNDDHDSDDEEEYDDRVFKTSTCHLRHFYI